MKAAFDEKAAFFQYKKAKAMLYESALLEQKVKKAIENLSFTQKPSTLFEPIQYILSLGGKRVRPVLTLMGANLFSGDVDKAMNAAIGLEIFHNFSLLHDDVMDKADRRRGQPTVHKKWNDNVAILSGDAMLIEAYNYISKVPIDLLPEVLRLFSETAMEVCRGQQFDMDFEKRNEVEEAEYLEMIRLKTAVLIGCALKMGAIIANASANEADLLYQYGIHIGLAFQLKDDLLDVYGDPKIFGKNIGGDIVSNKKTFLLIKAFKMANQKQKEELHRWISTENFNPQEKITAVKKVYDELNIKFISENLIEKYYLAAMDFLSAIHIADNRKKELLFLSENLMYREK